MEKIEQLSKVENLKIQIKDYLKSAIIYSGTEDLSEKQLFQIRNESEKVWQMCQKANWKI